MNNIEVIGGKPRQRELVESIAHYVIKKLMPRTTTLDVTIRLKTIHEAAGYCLSYDRREFELEIKRDLKLADLLKTVAHELVHVKQYAKGELKPGRFDAPVWQGRSVSLTKNNYWDLPWEIEAHGREHGLFIRWADQEGLLDKKWAKL